MELICSLDEIGAGDAQIVGLKASILGQLLRSGFPVPRGFALTTGAYSIAIQQLQPHVDALITPEVIFDPAEIEVAASQVRGWIEHQTFPQQLQEQLAASLARFESKNAVVSFAARTSLPSADLSTAFGSGVQRVVIGLVGAESVQRGVAQCWAALWTSRSMYYRHRKKIPQTSVGIGVLVQPMLNSESAGRIFTCNPVSNDPTQLQIESIWGLGAPLAQGRMQPDRFLLSKADGRVVDRTIAEKTVRLDLGTSGLTEQNVVAPSMVEAPSLTDVQASRLAVLATRIEQTMGNAQDIEWAFVAGEPQILQSRPMEMRTS